MTEEYRQKYEAPAGAIWVCRACGKTAKNRTEVGDESCFMNASLCYETHTGEWTAVEDFPPVKVAEKMSAFVGAEERIRELEAELDSLRKETMEVCICAAIRTKDGNVYRGHRHGDCFIEILARGTDRSGCEQGFVTSRNRFVSRSLGRILQDAAGIPSAYTGGFSGNTLLSEDLY